MTSEFKQFYENIDRDTKYSADILMEKHPFYKDLKRCIDSLDLEGQKGLEIGSGTGAFQNIVDDYTGLDVSENARKYYHKPYHVIDEQDRYPFEDETFDFVFTNAVFEHVPNINLGLAEMLRVVRKGGYVLFKPAWNCRSWAANGYQVRPYSDFNLWGKFIKWSIPIRDNKYVRASYVFPKRLIYLLLYLVSKRSFSNSLTYRKLKPNYETFWQSDSDAVNSIDPFMAILYFRANGLKVINYPNLVRAYLIKTGIVIVRK